MGLGYWQIISLTLGVAEPWNSSRYWTIAYPGVLILSAVAGFVLGGRGGLIGAVLVLAQLPVILMNSGAGPLLAVGLGVLALTALPAMILGGVSAARRRLLEHRSRSR